MGYTAGVDGIHDLGGMDGFGPVDVEARRAGLPPRVGAPGVRPARRDVGAASHATPTRSGTPSSAWIRRTTSRSSYYEHWLTGVATLLVEKGLVDPRRAGAPSGGAASRSSRPRRVGRRGRAAPTSAGAALRGRRRRSRAQHAPARPHALPALRARQARRGRARRRPFALPDVAAHGRQAVRRADVRRALRRPASCGARTPAPRRPSTSTSGRATWRRHERHDDDDHHHPAPLSPVEARARALEELLTREGAHPGRLHRRRRQRLRERHRPDERRARRGARLGRSGVPRAPARRRHGGDRRARLRRPGGRAPRRRREHARRAQRRRLHAVLVLPVAGPRAAADLVQEPAVPRAHGARAARCCCARWVSTCPRTSRSASGTRAPRSATWSCPSGRPAPRRASEEELAALVTRDAMIGTARP